MNWRNRIVDSPNQPTWKDRIAEDPSLGNTAAYAWQKFGDGVEGLLSLPKNAATYMAAGTDKGIGEAREFFGGPADNRPFGDVLDNYRGSMNEAIGGDPLLRAFDTATTTGSHVADAVTNTGAKPRSTADRYIGAAAQGAGSAPFGPAAIGLGALGGLGSEVGGDATEQYLGNRLPGELIGGFAGPMAGGRIASSLLKSPGPGLNMPSTEAARLTARNQKAADSATRRGVGINPNARTTPDYINEQVSSRLGPRIGNATSDVDVGSRIQRSTAHALKDLSNQGSRDFSAIARQVPEGARVQPTATFRALEIDGLQDTTNKITKTLEPNKVTGLRRAMIASVDDSRSLSYREMDLMRRDIGYRLREGGTQISKAEKAKLQNLWKSIGDDMRDYLRSNGGDDLVNHWNRANADFSRRSKEINQRLVQLGDRGVSPEDVYRKAMSTKTRGPTRLAGIKEELTPEDWDVLRSTVLRDMAYGNDGFDVKKLATEWNKLHPNARGVLFDDLGEEFQTLMQGIQNPKVLKQFSQTSSGAIRDSLINIQSYAVPGAVGYYLGDLMGGISAMAVYQMTLAPKGAFANAANSAAIGNIGNQLNE